MLIAGFTADCVPGGIHPDHVTRAGLLAGSVLMLLVARMDAKDRRQIEERLALGLVCLTTGMIALPDLIAPESARWIQPAYRGIPRWRGWFLDPNHSGIILVLALTAAWHLRSLSDRSHPGRHALTLLAAGFGLHLAWTYSRTAWLVLAVLGGMQLGLRWRHVPERLRRLISVLLLVSLLTAPVLIAWGLTTEAPHPRRLASFANILDPAWGNRVFTAGMSLQAMLDRPWTGWGWDSVGRVMELLYKPAFLNRASAFWLNDYARVGAAFGIPALQALFGATAWMLSRRIGGIAWQWALCLAVAMFFQGVISAPPTHAVLCISAAILFGAPSPRRPNGWTGWNLPWFAALLATSFAALWFLVPWTRVTFTVKRLPDYWVVRPKQSAGGATILLETSGDPLALGPMARAIAAKGLRAIIAPPRTEEGIAQAHRLGVWTIGNQPGPRVIPAERVTQRDPALNGTVAAQYVLESCPTAGLPNPDQPAPLRHLLLGLYFLAFVLAGAAVKTSWPKTSGTAAIALAAASVIPTLACQPWPHANENAHAADWAAQMRTLPCPEAIRRHAVVDPCILPGFTLNQRTEVWATFHQVTVGEDAWAMAGAARKAFALQFTVVPGDGPPRDFPELWRTRACTYREACYAFAGVLRSVNIPAKIESGAVRIWTSGQWIPVLSLPPESTGS